MCHTGCRNTCPGPSPTNCLSVCRDIVVLADVPKRDLDEEMQRTLHGSRLHWVTR